MRPYAQIGPRRGKRGKDKRHEGQRQRQNQEAGAEAKGTGREARGKPPGPARTYKKNLPVSSKLGSFFPGRAEISRVGDIHGPNPYKFIGFGNLPDPVRELSWIRSGSSPGPGPRALPDPVRALLAPNPINS